MRFVRDLLTCGFSTREIREFLPCFEDLASDPFCISGRERYRRKLSQVDTLLVALQERRQALIDRIERF